jgi:hypothetical protein
VRGNHHPRDGRAPRRDCRHGLDARHVRGPLQDENMFVRLPIHWMWWPALGGLIVGLGGVIICSPAGS